MVPFQFKETALAECIDDGWPPIVCVDRGRFLCAVGLGCGGLVRTAGF